MTADFYFILIDITLLEIMQIITIDSSNESLRKRELTLLEGVLQLFPCTFMWSTEIPLPLTQRQVK